MFSWFDASSGTYEVHLQKLNAYGTAEWESDGKIITNEAIFGLEADGSGGAYGSGGSGTVDNLIPKVYRIDENGNMLWGSSGIPVSASSLYFYRTGEVMPIIASDDGDGAIIGWAGKSGSNTNVYVQKVTTRYYSSGVYTSEAIQNTDTRFAGWGNISWEATGTVTAKVRSATSSSALSSASWTTATNGGSIPSNGPFIQAQLSLASADSDRTTSSLRSLSFNYSIDTAFPSIESVKADTVTLSTSTTTDIAPSPTIEVTLTDDYQISYADIKVDDVSLSPPLPSPSTRWVIRSTVTTPLSTGSHTIAVEVTDSSGNTTTNTYEVAVASRPEVRSGSVRALAEGSKISVSYELNSPSDVTIEIRTLTGELVRKVFAPGGVVGANEFSVDRGDLGKGAYLMIISPVGGAPVSARVIIQ
jgi:hypothetical protein